MDHTRNQIQLSNCGMHQSWSFDSDLEDILKRCDQAWNLLPDSRIFITGGTGFIGCWLLESLRYANIHHQLGIHATILTRDPALFKKKVPHLADYTSFSLLKGDVCNFDAPPGNFSHLIHAATDASADLNENDPRRMFDTVIQGTRRTLNFALEKGIDKVLFLSSGAVYGQQPWDMERVSENYTGAPNCIDPKACYAEGKRAAEMLCAIYGKQFGLKISIARIFALLGPYLSLDIHFAAGNFIRDAIHGKKIIVKGNGLPCRSYLYASDLTVWLWNMLTRAEPGKPYNVGSDESVSIKELAEKVSNTLGQVGYSILGAADSGWNLGRYVPDTRLIQRDLNLRKTVELSEAIRRTALWHGWTEGKNTQ